MSIFKSNFFGRSASIQFSETKPGEWKNFLTAAEKKSYDDSGGPIRLNRYGGIFNCLLGASLLATGSPLGIVPLAAGIFSLTVAAKSDENRRQMEMTALTRAVHVPPKLG